MYKRVLVTLDGSQTSEAVLPQAQEFCLATGAEMTLLMVAEAPHAVAEDPRPLVTTGAPAPGGVVAVPGPRTIETKGQAIDVAREEVGRYLDSKAALLAAEGVTVHTHVAFGKPVEEILAHARELDADLIMMATHGHTGLGQVVFGSVASRVLGSGVRPVLLVRPDRLGK
jgi:nucleotide-binding universal stress UspA family protein